MTVAIKSWRETRKGKRALDIERQIERSMNERRSLDPRAQIIILIAMNLMATTPTPMALDIIGVFLAAAILVYCKRLAAATVWLVVYVIVWLAALLCAMSADPLFVSSGAMLMMMRKVFSIAMLATNLIFTIRVGELACALQSMHVPRLVIIALCVVLRFFPILGAEASAVVQAMKLRGIRLSLKNIVRHPLKMIEYFAVPLLLRISVVTDEIARAVTVRGIDSKHKRTSLHVLRIGVAGWIFLILVAIFAVASIVLVRDEITFMGLF
ncbi:MAG: energy-coupling factor transporter transmembrane protein EcfT [Coriobacteriales bacterium]|nr:energy-coupling factor transporter transmembrane protein EcfT [Coriobacteriales bacterium]